MIPVVEAAERMSARVPTAEITPTSIDLSLWGSSPDHEPITENSALSVSSFWAGVTLISEAMATIPLRVYRTKKSGGRDIADDHPANYALTKTNNGWQVPSVFKSFGQGCLLMSGNMVGEIVRNGRGQCVEIHPWLPANTHYGIDSNGKPMYGVTETSQSLDVPIWRNDYSDFAPRWLPFTETVHLKGFSCDGFIGKKILSTAGSSIDFSLTLDKYKKKFFTKGNPPGFLVKNGNLSKEQRFQLREEWAELQEGVKNAFAVGILSNGLDWKTMGYNNNDAQLIQQLQFDVQQWARLLRLPPPMLGDLSDTSDSTIEQLMLWFITFTLLPWMARWREELDLKLFTPREQFAYSTDFDIDAFLKGDKLTLAKVDESDLRNGIRTLDEIRISKGRNPYPDSIGNKPLIMASQLDTLENVMNGTSLLHGNHTKPEATKP